MSVSRALCLLVLSSVLSAAAPPAGAGDDPVTRRKVQTYLDLAAELFKAKDFEGALGELKRAEKLNDLAVIGYNIARCYEELDNEIEAVTAFERYLALKDLSPGAPDRQKRARQTVAKLAPKLLGGLEVTCQGKEATVFIVELMQAPEPCPWKGEKLKPGTYEVQTFTPGFVPFVTKVTIPPGKSVLVAAQAVPAPKEPEPKPEPVATTPAAPVPQVPAPPAPPTEPVEPKAAPVTEQGYNLSVF